MLKSYFILVLMSLLYVSNSEPISNTVENSELTISEGKYKVGDKVKCTAWNNGSYWEGKVVKVVKDVVYKVELEKVSVAGTFQLYLAKSECTGKKKLSFEDGKGYNATRIWIHQRCLD